jgi:hypothetical protein
MKKPATLSRVMFVTSRQGEFFREKGLTMQFGAPKALWPAEAIREMIDNALDATEATNVAPEIAITLEPDSVTVADNGPGLPPSTVTKAIDYNVGVSSNRHYVAPTRGQLGNALKCIFPAAYVATGKKSVVEISACGIHHRIEADINRITQEPRIQHLETPLVQNGTTITIHWPGIACWTSQHYDSEMYQGSVEKVLPELVRDFACLNPHASFTVAAAGKKLAFKASDPGWRKWRASDPTSAHWYRKSDLGDQIAAQIAHEEKARQETPSLPRKTLRDFVAEFDGLSRPQYRQRVLQQAGLAGKYVSDLKADVDGEMEHVGRLLAAMRSVSKRVKPQRLGVIGRDHMQAALAAYGANSGIEYSRQAGFGDDGLPYVVEVGFGVTRQGIPRKLLCGLNHSIVFKVPSSTLYSTLRDCWIGSSEPVVIVVHQSHPLFKFTGHGKGSV